MMSSPYPIGTTLWDVSRRQFAHTHRISDDVVINCMYKQMLAPTQPKNYRKSKKRKKKVEAGHLHPGFDKTSKLPMRQ